MERSMSISLDKYITGANDAWLNDDERDPDDELPFDDDSEDDDDELYDDEIDAMLEEETHWKYRY